MKKPWWWPCRYVLEHLAYALGVQGRFYEALSKVPEGYGYRALRDIRGDQAGREAEFLRKARCW